MNIQTTPQTPALTLTELEERLAAPGGEALRTQLLAQLAATHARLTQRLAGMVPRAEFPALNASAEALHAAQQVLKQWDMAPR